MNACLRPLVNTDVHTTYFIVGLGRTSLFKICKFKKQKEILSIYFSSPIIIMFYLHNLIAVIFSFDLIIEGVYRLDTG